MNSRRAELRPLIGPGAAALAALVVLAAVAWFGSDWLASRENAYRQARAELSRAASQYRNASDDQAVYEQYASRFRTLQQRGLIGAEQRLSWVEALQGVNQELKLPVLQYEIAQQERVGLAGVPFDVAHLRLRRSKMTLRFDALHEGDVLQLLQSLADSGAGMMEVEQCGFRSMREAGALQIDPPGANLGVECRLSWYTLAIDMESGS